MNGPFQFRFLMAGLLSALALLAGCDNGDIEKAAGNYEVTVVDPNGQSAVGSASVTNSGDTFSIVIHSDVGDFAIVGTLVGNELTTTFTDSSGSSATAFFEFSIDRSTFTGTIQVGGTTTTTEDSDGNTTTTTTDASVYVIRGIRL